MPKCAKGAGVQLRDLAPGPTCSEEYRSDGDSVANFWLSRYRLYKFVLGYRFSMDGFSMKLEKMIAATVCDISASSPLM